MAPPYFTLLLLTLPDHTPPYASPILHVATVEADSIRSKTEMHEDHAPDASPESSAHSHFQRPDLSASVARLSFRIGRMGRPKTVRITSRLDALQCALMTNPEVEET